MDHIAYLSSQNDYIIFNYKGKTVRFKGPYSLQKIVKVKEWDEGYIVVDVKYANKKERIVRYEQRRNNSEVESTWMPYNKTETDDS